VQSAFRIFIRLAIIPPASTLFIGTVAAQAQTHIIPGGPPPPVQRSSLE
jgi:hypothetical protein